MADFELAEPATLREALSLLDGDDPGVRPIGGGTALMLMMKARLFAPVRLVSLRRLESPLSGIAVEGQGEFIRIGAMATFAQLEHSPDVARLLPVLRPTMRDLANVRVRNVATVGGNLAHGDPHLDLPPVWAALGAQATIISRKGERVVPVEEIAAGYYETTIANGEIISHIRVPVKPAWRSTYVKVTTRAAHDWPALGLALSVCFERDRIADLRLFLSAAVDRPTRLVAAEQVLRGARLDATILARAGEAAVAEAGIHSDSRGSAAYKNQLLRVHLGRAMNHVAGSDGQGRPS